MRILGQACELVGNRELLGKAAYYDAATDFWLVADRDGTVCGEHDERDPAVAEAKKFAAGET